MSILDELASHARERTEINKGRVPFDEMRAQAMALPKGDFSFERALKKPEMAVICECKKASPSKGVIDAEFPYLEIAKTYEAAGADCLSVLTEPKWFLGSDNYLKEIAEAVERPCLRKDFVIDAYMIYEAKVLGAAAVLLICALLDEEQLAEYLAICDSLGMTALVETHDAREVDMALRAGARVIGVNNRNLRDFSVVTTNSQNLRTMVGEEVVFVSESGIMSADDARAMREGGADAILVGEYMMRAKDKGQALAALRGTL